MRRLFMVLLVFTANAGLFAAGSSDLLVAIRNGDHSRVQKLLGAGADVNAFPHGWNQFASEAGSSWATMALLFTLPDKPPVPTEPLRNKN